VAAVKLCKRWTWPRRLPLGAGAASQPPCHGSGIEVGGLAAHAAEVAKLIETMFEQSRRLNLSNSRPSRSGLRRFTEGFDTRDLKEAKALLDELLN
jgi:hypothetical protein